MTAPYRATRIRAQLRPIQLERFYRIIHRRHQDQPLGVVATPSRFSDPDGQYGVLYASAAVRCSFWEAIARNRFTHRKNRVLPRSDVASRLIVALRSTEPVTLVDLRSDGPIRLSAPTAVAHDAHHAAGRALSAAVAHLVPEADGFLFHSRFTGHACIAVYERAIVKLDDLFLSPLAQHGDFLDALDDYDIALIDPQRDHAG